MTTCDLNQQMKTLKDMEAYAEMLDIMQYLWMNLINHHYPSADKVSFNIVIDALGRAKQYDRMERAFDSMIQSGFRPGITNFTSMMGAYANERHGVEVLRVFDDMRRRGVEPNERTYRIFKRMIHPCF